MLSPDRPSLLTSRSGRVKAARRLVRRPARAEHRLFLTEGPQGGIWYLTPATVSSHPDERVPDTAAPKSCGNEFETRSTQAEIHVDVCSACHPFSTGKQKLMDAGGRVERFQRRLEKAGGSRRG